MAMREVVIEDSGGGQFYKFETVGQSLLARFLSFEEKPSNFPGKTDQNYSLRTKDGDVTITAPANLAQKLRKADLKRGQVVQITYTGDLPATKEGYSPMRLFKVLVDDVIPPAAAAKPPAPKPPPPAREPGDDLEDIPF